MGGNGEATQRDDREKGTRRGSDERAKQPSPKGEYVDEQFRLNQQPSETRQNDSLISRARSFAIDSKKDSVGGATSIGTDASLRADREALQNVWKCALPSAEILISIDKHYLESSCYPINPSVRAPSLNTGPHAKNGGDTH